MNLTVLDVASTDEKADSVVPETKIASGLFQLRSAFYPTLTTIIKLPRVSMADSCYGNKNKFQSELHNSNLSGAL